MERRSLCPQMNRCLFVCLDSVPVNLPPFPLLFSWGRSLSHTCNLFWPLCSCQKQLCFGDQQFVSHHCFFLISRSFSECRALAVYPIFWSCVIAAVCCLMAGFQDCHWTPPPAPPPLRLLALSMWKAPFPRHCSAGTAFTVKSVPMEIEWGKEGDREMM